MKQKIRYYLKVFFLSALPSFLIFSFLFFPFEELGNLVTNQVAKATNNQVILSFNDMSFSLVPSPGLSFQNVELRGQMLPELEMKSLEVAPSIAGLLSLKPGVRVASEGLYGGNLVLNTKGQDKTAKGTLKHNIDLELQKVSLKKLLANFNFPLDLAGNINLDLDSNIDPAFDENPEGELELNISPFRLNGGSINTGVMGEISLPPLVLKQARMKAQLKKNKLKVTELRIGSPGEAVMISVKADLDIRLQKMGLNIVPSPGQYDAEIEINAGPEFEKDYGVYLSFLEQYKRSQANRNIYRMKVSGLNFRRPPKMEAF
jgi:type II secretion system protein N